MTLNQYSFLYEHSKPPAGNADSVYLVMDREAAYYLAKMLLEGVYQNATTIDLTLIGKLLHKEPLVLSVEKADFA